MKIKFTQDFHVRVDTNMGVMGSKYFTKDKLYPVNYQDGYLIYVEDDVGKGWEINLNDRGTMTFEIVEE